MDFTLSPYMKADADNKWLMTYRMLCKRRPATPEVFLDFSGFPHMNRSFFTDTVYAPLPKDADNLQRNDSTRLYERYLEDMVKSDRIETSFLDWSRSWTYCKKKKAISKRSTLKATAVGVRYRFELQDAFVGQFCCMMLPHKSPMEFRQEERKFLEYTENYLGAIAYLANLKWKDSTTVEGMSTYAASAFPRKLPSGDTGRTVFASDNDAHAYLRECILDDLEKRCIAESRRMSCVHRLHATRSFAQYAKALTGPEFERLQQAWTLVSTGRLHERVWSTAQEQVLHAITSGVCSLDENEDREAMRWLYVCGKPGSGKSEVLIHAAVRAADTGANVLILCPTGALCCAYKERLPANDRIATETLHSAFAITRKADKLVEYAPPSRLRKYDLMLIDEASQISDAVFRHVFLALKDRGTMMS